MLLQVPANIDIQIIDSLTVGTFYPPSQCITNAAIRNAAGVSASKLQHQYQLQYAQDPIHYKLAFTGGGAHEVIPGDILTGATSGATCEVQDIYLSSGGWGTSDAAGHFDIIMQKGTFVGENLDEGANGDVCTIAADSSTTTVFDTEKLLHICRGAGSVVAVEATCATVPAGTVPGTDPVITIDVNRIRGGVSHTVLTTGIVIDSDDADYDILVGSIDGSYDDLLDGDVLEVTIVNTPGTTGTDAAGLVVNVVIREAA